MMEDFIDVSGRKFKADDKANGWWVDGICDLCGASDNVLVQPPFALCRKCFEEAA